MKLTDMQRGSIVLATEAVQDNLGTIFPAGTMFRIDEMDFDSDLVGPCMAPNTDNWSREECSWFYWDSNSISNIKPCRGKLVLVRA